MADERLCVCKRCMDEMEKWRKRMMPFFRPKEPEIQIASAAVIRACLTLSEAADNLHHAAKHIDAGINMDHMGSLALAEFVESVRIMGVAQEGVLSAMRLIREAIEKSGGEHAKKIPGPG